MGGRAPHRAMWLRAEEAWGGAQTFTGTTVSSGKGRTGRGRAASLKLRPSRALALLSRPLATRQRLLGLQLVSTLSPL